MVRSSKWISGVQPNQLVTEVARRSVQARLDAVWHFAPLAAKKAKQDVEHVHQLRVSARRAKAALGLYAELLPRKKAKSINKMLRSLRTAAGDARDLDVLADRLKSFADHHKKVDFTSVLDEIARRRKRAQKPLERSYLQAKKSRFKRRSRRLLQDLRWNHCCAEPVFATFARSKLRPMVDAFFDSARADLSDVQALHQMRIRGKQVRYGMELLSRAFDRSFRDEFYPVFGDVQEKLGAINDHATAIALFKNWLEGLDSETSQTALDELVLNEKTLLNESRRNFLSWWSADRAAALAERVDALLESQERLSELADGSINQSTRVS